MSRGATLKYYVALFILCGAAFGQSNNFRPVLVQSYSDRIQNNCASSCQLNFLDNVTAGNVLYVAFSDIASSVSPSDSLGTVYTMSSIFSNGPDGSGATALLQIGCGIAPTSGADTVTVASQHGTYEATILEVSGMGTCTADATATANSTLSGSPSYSLTIAPTTTNSNEICISYGANWFATENMWSDGNATGGDGSIITNLLDYRISGAAGAQSIVYHMNQQLFGGSALAWLAHTQCYTPTLIVATDALPHGAQSVAYSAQLVSVGGSGSSRTWSVSSGSLPSGLSLAASTGKITGTPSGSVGTTSFTVQISDGTHTATRSLSIGVGAAFAVPAVVGSAAFAVGPVSYSATAGNLLLVGFWGSEARGSYIWTPQYSGTNNKLTGSPALSFRRLYPLPGTPGNNQGANGAPMSIYAACVPQTTTYSIDFLANPNQQLPPNHAAIKVIETSGTQGIIDDGFIANTAGFSSSPGTITVSGTSFVPNTLAVLFGNNTSAVTSPFTLIEAGSAGTEFLTSGYDLISSAGSFNATTSTVCTTNCTELALSAEVIPLRPDISGLACGTNPAGGGSSAPIRHKGQVY